MGSKWEKAKLTDHYEIRSGLSKPAKDFGSGYPFLTFKNVFYNYFVPSELTELVQSTEKERAGCSVQRGDVFLTRTSETMNELGMSCVALKSYENSSFNGFCKRLRPKPESDLIPEYVGYYLRSPRFRNDMLAFSTMSTRASLNNDMIGRLDIYYPSPDSQRKVAHVLKSFDDKITINHQTNQTLEKMAQTLFKSWFVDFDPVKAKMNGEQPKGMDALFLSKEVASLFPEKLVESELGLIPDGWNVGTLSDVAKYCSARTNTDTISLENYISTENMLAEKKGVTAASKLPTAKTVAAYKSGDILVSNIRPYFKKIWLAEGSGGRSNDVLGFESVSENTDSYLMNLLYQDTFFEYMTRTSKGAKMPRGDKTAIMNWEMAVPPVELREAFSAIVDKFYQLIPQNRAQNATLESLRDTLLPKLLSGEIDLESVQVEQVKELAE
ncbi:restriction endonuclease subunit S [Vibrio splendidus]